MGRRPRDKDDSDDSEQEAERSSNEEDEGSSEGRPDSGDSGSDESVNEESDEEENEVDDDENVEKLALVARDIEQMRAMCEEMDKMKQRLQFRMNAAREAKQDALQREAELREHRERRQAAAADFDAPQPIAQTTTAPVLDEQPPPPPVQALKTDVCVQTDCDMAEMNRMEASCQESTSPAERTAPVSPSKSDTFRIDPAVSESARAVPASVDERSPGLSIYDLDKSDGVNERGVNDAASAFYDHVLTSISRSKKMDTIPSVSGESERSASPDQQAWPYANRHHAEDSFTRNGTHRTARSSFDNRPTTVECVSRDTPRADSANGPNRYAPQQSIPSSHGLFDAQDSLRAPLSPLSTAPGDKTDEQRELEAIQSLLFGR